MKKRWRHSVGDYGMTVTVREASNGMMYARMPGGRRESLGHRDRKRAKTWAKEMHAKLVLELTNPNLRAPTVERVFQLYLEHHSPSRTAGVQADDRRQVEAWTRVLGPKKDLHALTRGEWEQFARDRASGAIDSRGRSVPASKRRKVRDRTVGRGQEWLRGLIRWACTWQDRFGHYVMRDNPMRGYAIAKEKNPRRPVASEDRFVATRAVSDDVTMKVWIDGTRCETRSHLSEILDIVNGAGRRIGAVAGLQYADLRLGDGEHGMIHWRQDTDKMGKEWLTPINAQVRAAVDRILAERPGLGRMWLFPSPRNSRRPVSKDLAGRWLRKAEALAGWPKLERGLWHPYRRKWATERKEHSDVDVALAGGWSDLTSLKMCYQLADLDTVERVVNEPTGRVREGRQA